MALKKAFIGLWLFLSSPFKILDYLSKIIRYLFRNIVMIVVVVIVALCFSETFRSFISEMFRMFLEHQKNKGK